MVAIGEAGPRVHAALAGAVAVRDARSMPQAVRQAYELANGTGVVVLAPACASFDWFRDYAERGRVFKDAVRALEEELRTR